MGSQSEASAGTAAARNDAHRGLIGRVALLAWALSTAILGVALLAFHQPLPLPEARAMTATGRWTLVHALSLTCPCSRRVLDYLKARGSRRDVEERILLVDADRAAGDELT